MKTKTSFATPTCPNTLAGRLRTACATRLLPLLLLLTLPAVVQAQFNLANPGVRTNRFGFTITGTSNLVIVVEACTNLANPIWSPVGTNTLTDGSSYFSDLRWTNYPGRFYRLRSP